MIDLDLIRSRLDLPRQGWYAVDIAALLAEVERLREQVATARREGASLELDGLGQWVRSNVALAENDDIRDNIARAITNRITQLRAEAGKV